MEWIKIEDEQPPLNVPVLVYGVGVGLLPSEAMAVYERYVWPDNSSGTPCWRACGVSGYEYDISPSHWARLPEPPEGDEQ